jgi:hypothetical protein
VKQIINLKQNKMSDEIKSTIYDSIEYIDLISNSGKNSETAKDILNRLEKVFDNIK